jgi:hypothetical protein
MLLLSHGPYVTSISFIEATNLDSKMQSSVTPHKFQNIIIKIHANIFSYC